jgi:hypothetical protein
MRAVFTNAAITVAAWPAVAGDVTLHINFTTPASKERRP